MPGFDSEHERFYACVVAKTERDISPGKFFRTGEHFFGTGVLSSEAASKFTVGGRGIASEEQ
jgi:hypothetical protein